MASRAPTRQEEETVTEQVGPAPEPTPTPRPPRVLTRREQRHQRRLERAGRTSSVKLVRVSPWSVGLVALLLSLVLAASLELGVFLLWHLFSSAGIFDKIVTTIAPTGGESAATLRGWLTLQKFLAVGAALSSSLVILIPVGSFLAAVLFNLSSRIFGGVRIVLVGDR